MAVESDRVPGEGIEPSSATYNVAALGLSRLDRCSRRGQVVGWSTYGGTGFAHAFVWTASTGMIDLWAAQPAKPPASTTPDRLWGGATVLWTPPVLQVSPATNITASGTRGEAFSPTSFNYELSSATGSLNYSISGIPSWLNANFTSGTATTSPVTVTFSLTNLGTLTTGSYAATIAFTNNSTGNGNTTRSATLTVKPENKRECSDGGWKHFISPPGPFKNQGQCVSYFEDRRKHRRDREQDERE
jgi:probable HAF family extracellular repeat protein